MFFNNTGNAGIAYRGPQDVDSLMAFIYGQMGKKPKEVKVLKHFLKYICVNHILHITCLKYDDISIMIPRTTQLFFLKLAVEFNAGSTTPRENPTSINGKLLAHY